MVNGYRSHKFGKISTRSVHERATRGGHGAGQPAVADEGFGVRVAERLYAHYHWPSMWRLSMAVLRD